MDANLGNLYDMNKMAMQKVTPINKRHLSETITKIAEDYLNRNSYQYYMLLCKELSDYTLFDFKNKDTQEFKEALKDCINNRGRAISLDYDEKEGSWEIWILIDGNNPCCYYLFPFDEGVVVC